MHSQKRNGSEFSFSRFCGQLFVEKFRRDVSQALKEAGIEPPTKAELKRRKKMDAKREKNFMRQRREWLNESCKKAKQEHEKKKWAMKKQKKASGVSAL